VYCSLFEVGLVLYDGRHSDHSETFGVLFGQTTSNRGATVAEQLSERKKMKTT
jgi:hypothetical protein